MALPPILQVLAERHRLGDLGAGLAAHEPRQAARQLALRALGKALDQHVGDDEAEHPVAEELEPLIGLRLLARASGDRARMGQSAVQEFGIGEVVSELLFADASARSSS